MKIPKAIKIYNPCHQRGFKVSGGGGALQENGICDHDMWAKLRTEMTEIKMESGVDLAKRPSEMSASRTGVTQYSFFFKHCT